MRCLRDGLKSESLFIRRIIVAKCDCILSSYRRQGHFEKRAIEFPDFEEFANYNSMPFPDFDYGDDATEDDELEGDDLMVKRGSFA